MSSHMPAEVNFTFLRGEDVAITWTIRESATGAARDITGWTFALPLKQHPYDVIPAESAMHEITNAAAGQVRSTLAASVTEDLEGKYAYRLWRMDEGFVSCQARGTITFEL
jgi:hypothetical protein